MSFVFPSSPTPHPPTPPDTNVSLKIYSKIQEQGNFGEKKPI